MRKQNGMVRWVGLALMVFFGIVLVSSVLAQDAAAPAAPEANAPAAAGELVLDKSAVDNKEAPTDTGFMAVVMSSGVLGVLIWLGLLGSLISCIYFTIDCSMTVKAKRIIPPTLVEKVTAAMAQGDVVKALQECKEEPGPMANILVAAFSHVEEGFDTIQEAVQVAADFESERMMQHIAWLSVTASLAPMLGLLGTVQGMIWAFAGLATMGAGNVGVLALAISQALWTTAAGLCVAIPAITSYTIFRNVANRMTLRMQAITMDLIKDLRNVEVVAE
jgi:biopolymer transport protein ExbB